MLLHLDGSPHAWFGDGRRYDLLVVLDDATSEIYYAQLVEEESTRTVMAALREVIERQGVFCALYSDRASHFFETPKAGGKVNQERLTQVGRALRELGIRMIPAYSPQPRGRSERNFRTWQGRLPQELRLRGIRTLEEANRFLREEYRAEFNEKFSAPAAQPGSAFVRRRGQDLERIFSVQQERTVNRDNTVQIGNRLLQIDKTPWRNTLAGCRVTVYEHRDGALSVGYGPHVVGRFNAEGMPLLEPLPRRGKGSGKAAPWESHKPTFPLRLEIPHTSRDSHFPTASTTGLSRLLEWNQEPWLLHYDWTKNGGQVSTPYPPEALSLRSSEEERKWRLPSKYFSFSESAKSIRGFTANKDTRNPLARNEISSQLRCGFGTEVA